MKDEEAILPSSTEVVEETIESAAVVDIGENIRLVGTAHISRASAELVKRQIEIYHCLLYTSPSPRDGLLSRMPSSA